MALFTFGWLLLATALASPLRVDPDSEVLLHLATTISDHQPYRTIDQQPAVFPLGIPTLFSLLDRSGLASSFTFVSINLIGLSLAAFSLWWICHQGDTTPIAAASGLLAMTWSWVIIKHFPLPLTDIPFMGASLAVLACLASIKRTSGLRQIVWIVLALALLTVSLFIRRNGVALVPAFLWTVLPWPRWLQRARTSISTRSYPTLISIGLISLILTIAAAALATRLNLVDMIASYRQAGPLNAARFILVHRLYELGELFLNTSMSKFARFSPIFQIAGASLIIILTCGLIARRRTLLPLDLYMFCFILILLVWPFSDTRFWLPIVPLLPIWVIDGLSWIATQTASAISSPAFARLKITWLAAFLLAGAIAHAYSLRITFSGPRFPDEFGSGINTRAYSSLLLGTPPQQALDPREQQFVTLLKRFGQNPLKKESASPP